MSFPFSLFLFSFFFFFPFLFLFFLLLLGLPCVNALYLFVILADMVHNIDYGYGEVCFSFSVHVLGKPKSKYIMRELAKKED